MKEKKKKILVVSTVGLIYDGITSVILSYLKAMDLMDLDIHVVSTIRAEENIVYQIEKLGCTLVPLPDRKTDTKKYALSLARYIKTNNIQVIHAHGNSGTLAIEMAAAWLGGCKRRIAHSHNTKCSQIKADKILRPIFNRLYTEAIACGEDAGKWLFGNRPFKVLANGRDVKEYAYSEKNRTRLRKYYGIEDKVVVGHVGGFVTQKNHRFLLRVYKAISEKEKDAAFFLIGDGILRKEMEEYAQELKMKDKIIFTGNIDNVNEVLSAMDGMLLPSLFEGLPLAVIEWQMNGLPVILADSVTSECIFSDMAGVKSLNASAEEWAEELLGMIKRNNRLENSEKNISAAKQAGFDIQASASELRAIYL